MTFCYRYRKTISLVALAALIVASAVTPAGAYYDPKTGRFVERDPNGTGLVLTPGLRYHGANPVVTVLPAYELQCGDGMNFYDYLRSNLTNRHDPAGLLTYNDMVITAGLIGDALQRSSSGKSPRRHTRA